MAICSLLSNRWACLGFRLYQWNGKILKLSAWRLVLAGKKCTEPLTRHLELPWPCTRTSRESEVLSTSKWTKVCSQCGQDGVTTSEETKTDGNLGRARIFEVPTGSTDPFPECGFPCFKGDDAKWSLHAPESSMVPTTLEHDVLSYSLSGASCTLLRPSCMCQCEGRADCK